jgi:radical SAM protein with 4Fe4S-binding SPASM domain
MAESLIPQTKVFDIKVNENFNRWRKEEGKLKGPRCKECKYFKCCEGPWREYPRLFGWEEFKPVK